MRRRYKPTTRSFAFVVVTALKGKGFTNAPAATLVAAASNSLDEATPAYSAIAINPLPRLHPPQLVKVMVIVVAPPTAFGAVMPLVVPLLDVRTVKVSP